MIVAVLLALAFGWWLIPDRTEIALIRLKTKDYDAARAQYRQLLAEGRDTQNVLIPLARLALIYGEVNEAAELVERYVAKKPNDLEARRMLGELYQYAQRPDDYLANLEVSSELEAEPDQLLELAAIYNYKQEYEKQAEVLRRYLDANPDNSAQYQNLINLLSHMQQFDDALEVVAELTDRNPDLLTRDTLFLSVKLSLDRGDVTGAGERARMWLKRETLDADLVAFANLMLEAEQPMAARALVETYPERLASVQTVREVYAQSLLAAGLAGDADAFLRPDYEAGSLALVLRDEYVDALLDQQLFDQALTVAETGDRGSFEPWQKLRLMEAAMELTRLDLAQTLMDEIGDAYLARRPVAAAELAWRRGDQRAYRRWLAEAKTLPDYRVDERLRLAWFLKRADETAQSATLLASLLSQADFPVRLLPSAAYLARELDMGAQVYPALEAADADTSPTPALYQAWAYAALDAGRGDALADWLPGRLPELDADFARGLAYSALDQEVTAPALLIAPKLYQDSLSDADFELLLATRLAADQLESALTLLEARTSQEPQYAERYVYVMDEAVEEGVLPSSRLIPVLSQQLARSDLDADKRQEWLYLAVDRGLTAQFLTPIKDLAYSGDAGWGYVYTQHLRTTGADQELAGFWRHLFDLEETSDTRKVQLAYLFLESGRRAEAEDAFFALADQAGPDDDAVRQMLYLWGPRPPKRAVDWLSDRARTAPVPERTQWLKRLAGVDQPQRVIAILKDERLPYDHPDLPVFLEALAAVKDRETLDARLVQVIPLTTERDKLWRYGQLAEAVTSFPRARDAYLRILELAPTDAQALRQLAMFAFAEGRRGEALDTFERLHEVDPGDYETHFFTAELFSERLEANRAENHYRIARDQLEVLARHNHRTRTILAQIYHRLDLKQQAVALYDALYREQPYNKHLRADYATMLIELGERQRADYVLEGRLD